MENAWYQTAGKVHARYHQRYNGGKIKLDASLARGTEKKQLGCFLLEGFQGQDIAGLCGAMWAWLDRMWGCDIGGIYRLY